MFLFSIIHDMKGGKQGTIEYVVANEVKVTKTKKGTLQVVSWF